jgi:ParB-like chromosome segregation protein Spo0J
MTTAVPSLPIDSIIIGERHRRDLGDIEGLAKSIDAVGLLHPIAVTFDGHLIAGERRLRAVQLLGWKTIPCTLIPINLDQIVRGEFAENAVRKDFTLSEAVAIKRALEPLEKAKAKERMVAAHASPEKFSEQAKGNALDKVATVVGKHRTTIAKAEAVVDAASAEPEKFGPLLEQMDRTGRANGVYRRLKIAKEVGVDHKTISKARAKGEATGECSPVEKRIGKDGKARKQPKSPTKAPPKPSIAPNGKKTLYCSFCAKSQHDVGTLITDGQRQEPVCICNECVDVCVSVIAEQKTKTAPPPAPADGLDIPEWLRRTAP